MNKVFLIGNTTSDIELKSTSQGTSFCKFVLAVRRDKDTTDFIECEAWKVPAENISKYVSKGDKLAVSGSLHTYNYEGQDGTKKRIVSVTVYDFELMQRRDTNTPPAPNAAPKSSQTPQNTVVDDFDESELPF